MPRPTNEDLLTEITAVRTDSNSNHKEVVRRLNALEEQVRYTNGRVKKLEVESERRAAVEEYKQNHSAKQTKREQWFESAEVKKFFLALAALATAASAFLAYAAQHGVK